MGASSLDQRKRRMRRALRARATAEGSIARGAGEAAAALLSETPEYRSAARCLLFASLPDELPTRPLFEIACGAGKRCAFPRIAGVGRLEFAFAARWEDLAAGRYGLLEPGSGSPPVALGTLDLLVVPGVAFDRRGGRLGRGEGYYDRALAGLREGGVGEGRPRVFGWAPSWRLVDEVPRGRCDQPVDAIVTEKELMRVEATAEEA